MLYYYVCINLESLTAKMPHYYWPNRAVLSADHRLAALEEQVHPPFPKVSIHPPKNEFTPHSIDKLLVAQRNSLQKCTVTSMTPSCIHFY